MTKVKTGDELCIVRDGTIRKGKVTKVTRSTVYVATAPGKEDCYYKSYCPPGWSQRRAIMDSIRAERKRLEQVYKDASRMIKIKRLAQLSSDTLDNISDYLAVTVRIMETK